jgi:hypothetical protein
MRHYAAPTRQIGSYDGAAALADLDDDQRICGKADEVDFSRFAAEIFREHSQFCALQGIARH